MPTPSAPRSPAASWVTSAAVPGMAGCGDTVRFGGALPDGGTWVACTRGGAFQTIGPPRRRGRRDPARRAGRGRGGDRGRRHGPEPRRQRAVRLGSGVGDADEGRPRERRDDDRRGPHRARRRVARSPRSGAGWPRLRPPSRSCGARSSSRPTASRVYAIGVKAACENPDVSRLGRRVRVRRRDPRADRHLPRRRPTSCRSRSAPTAGSCMPRACPVSMPSAGDRGDQGASITRFRHHRRQRRGSSPASSAIGLITFGPEPLR